MLKQYSKSILYMLLATAGAFVAALSDNHLTTLELLNCTVVFLGTVPVYLIPNLPAGPGKYAKSISAFGVAGLLVVINLVAAGTGLADLTVANWLTVVIAAFAGIGVAIVPNEPAIDAGTDGDGVNVITSVPAATNADAVARAVALATQPEVDPTPSTADPKHVSQPDV